MPARSPAVGRTVAERLGAIGAQIRAQRKALKVSATVAAEAAGMSRVTLHRIETGEPSVAMGAYLSAISAVGLEVELSSAAAPRKKSAARRLPRMIRLADHPELRRLAWQLKGVKEVKPQQALELYERNWRHLDPQALTARERALIASLAAAFGHGRLLV